jgi:hypothetical protein
MGNAATESGEREQDASATHFHFAMPSALFSADPHAGESRSRFRVL